MTRIGPNATQRSARKASLTAPGLLLGIGLGGFIDGVLLHQILQNESPPSREDQALLWAPVSSEGTSHSPAARDESSHREETRAGLTRRGSALRTWS